VGGGVRRLGISAMGMLGESSAFSLSLSLSFSSLQSRARFDSRADLFLFVSFFLSLSLRWQRWRLVDFQMEQQQKEETLSKLEKKRDGVKKEIHELEQEVEARRRLDLKPRSSTSNGFVAVPTSNERGGVAIAVERRASFNSNGLGVPSALINPFSRGGSASAGGQSSSLEGKGSYGSLYGFSNERGGFSSNERGGGGFSSERGGFSNERGGVSNERGGDEDVEMDMDL